jgi:hypothetical protein
MLRARLSSLHLVNNTTMAPSRIFEGSETRPIFVDFNAYTDGDDEFKKELVDLMIDDLRELQQTLHLAAQHSDAPLFQKV